ncbi:MAG TPA: hypothetical protein VML19_04220 [Verrucomicrobiae bacterium]|nr:hypothetical protein [Verrucomicrobiae bacterium]
MKTPCEKCGQRAEKMHTLVFTRGTFCPACCPMCAGKPEQPTAPAQAPRGVVPRPAARRPQQAAPAATRGGSQWIDAGWGHRPDDPWTHDRDRHSSDRPRWIPRRPDWFRNVRLKLD